MNNHLRNSTATVDTGAAFRAVREGGLARVTPMGEVWLKANCAAEATWIGKALVIEMRYSPALADDVIEAGFLFERNSLPN